MDLQTIFYTLGSLFFFVSLVLSTVFIVASIFFYCQAKKKMKEFQDKAAYLKSLQESVGKLPAFLVPVIVFLLNFLIRKIKKRFSDD